MAMALTLHSMRQPIMPMQLIPRFSKAPGSSISATRRRTWSFELQLLCSGSGLQCIFSTTRLKIGLANQWFGKYLKYKRHEEVRITCLQQQHFPRSSIDEHDLAQDNIIYTWDVEMREQAIQFKREVHLKKEAAAAVCWGHNKTYIKFG